MKHRTRFSTDQQQQARSSEQQQSHATAREFASAEEALRFDAAQTPVPDAVARRLAESTASLPPPAAPWWRRLFKR